MSRKVNRASAIAVAATLLTTILSADGSGASAQALDRVAVINEAPPQYSDDPVVQPLPADDSAASDEGNDVLAGDATPVSAATLAELVEAQPTPADLPRELDCLAGAVYFEAKSESLVGQLAVGRVVVARAKSGRFPDSYCGVVFQRSQFSFVRGNAMPQVNRASRQWRNAVAIAQIAHEGAWRSPVEGALFFHAASVSPGWRLTRIARVDNHIFYR